MKNEATKRGILARISWRIKVIAILTLVVGGALAIVVSFAAGFGTSMVLAETGAKDRCAQHNGTWDQELKLCMKKEIQASSAVSGPVDTYTCGSGTRFTLQSSSANAKRFQVVGESNSRDLTSSSSGMSLYTDNEVILAFDGLDVQFEDQLKGTKTLCKLENTSDSRE